MADDAAVLLLDTRQEARNVNQLHQRNIERVAEGNELGSLVRSIDVKATRHHLRLVGHDADGTTIDPGKGGDDVGRPTGLDL